jgi:hypothetical protein
MVPLRRREAAKVSKGSNRRGLVDTDRAPILAMMHQGVMIFSVYRYTYRYNGE